MYSGQSLTIKASGTLLDKVEKGATVALEVKWGLITLVKQTVDLCDQIKNVDLTCPLEKGKMVLTKQVDLPKQIPPVSHSAFSVISHMLIGTRANTLFLPMSTPRTSGR